jgi:hypothetical protein
MNFLRKSLATPVAANFGEGRFYDVGRIESGFEVSSRGNEGYIAWEDALPICLYCKESDGPFTSVEHVIPESLGNQSLRGKKLILLPKGIVCDTCNNGKLAVLDNALIEFPPISWMRMRYGVRSKSGELPTTKLSNATIRSLSPGNILIEPGSSKKAFQFDRATGRFNMQWRSNRRMTPTYCRTITRAERFDPVRRMILGLDEFHGYFVVAAKEQPPAPNQPKAQLTYWFRKNDRGEESVFAAFYFLGVEMATDLEIREWQRPSDLPENSINVLEF